MARQGKKDPTRLINYSVTNTPRVSVLNKHLLDHSGGQAHQLKVPGSKKTSHSWDEMLDGWAASAVLPNHPEIKAVPAVKQCVSKLTCQGGKECTVLPPTSHLVFEFSLAS